MDMQILYNKKSSHSDGSELDFVKHWVDRSIQSSIIQGQNLQKLKEYRPLEVEECDVNNVNLNRRPFCETSTARSKSTKKIKITTCKKAAHRTTKKSSKSIITDVTDDCLICICPHKKINRKRHKKCPLRIIQLAVPTKRQCLETWKTSYRILPDIMIDRLRQYIIDQRPVVQVSDAIRCFQRKKKTRKVKKKKDIKKDMKSIGKIDINSININDPRYFCGVFGYKISKELNKPRVIQLNSELEKIANVVTMDIAHLLSSRTKTETIKAHARNQLMCNEISGKIAIWIWGILEESYYNILEDQLRDLDEELGPPLDILDEIIDNVVDLCEPEPPIIDIPHISESSSNSEATNSLNEDKIDQKSESTTGKVKVNYSINVEYEITNEINNIIDKHIAVDELLDKVRIEQNVEGKSEVRSLDDRENEFQDAIDLSLISLIVDKINDHIQDKDKTQVSPVEDDIIELSGRKNYQVEDQDEASQAKDETNEEGDEINDQVEDEEGNQVSDLPEDFHDGNKKVTFEIESVNTDFWFEETWKRPRKTYKEQSPEVRWPSLSEINFSTPNKHLLTEVDESWPLDILKDETILRPSASISKSISSLGNIIFENEDTISESNDDIQPSPSELQEKELDKITDYTLLGKEDLLKDNAIDTTHLKVTIDHNSKSVQTSIDLSNMKRHKSEGTSTSPVRSKIDLLGHSKAVTSYSLEDLKKKGDQIISLKKSRPKYKVHPCTAPSWALNGFTEISGYPCLRKHPINQRRMRQWCTDLLIGYNNLELWNDWIIHTCKLIKNLESKKVASCKNKFAKERTKLKNEIDHDATTLTNKHRCIRKHLNKYKDIYQKTPICKNTALYNINQSVVIYKHRRPPPKREDFLVIGFTQSNNHDNHEVIDENKHKDFLPLFRITSKNQTEITHQK